MAATPAMLPLTLLAALKAEVAEVEPLVVLEPVSGVEEPGGLELGVAPPEPPVGVVEPVGAGAPPVDEPEPVEATEVSAALLLLLLPVSAAEVEVAEVSAGAEVLVVSAALVVSTGGTEMGWPADEH